jgi:hypothetical protein
MKNTIALQPYGRTLSTLFHWVQTPDNTNNLCAIHQQARNIMSREDKLTKANWVVIDCEITNDSGVIFLQATSLRVPNKNITDVIKIGFGKPETVTNHQCVNFNAAWYLMCALLARMENLQRLIWIPKSVFCTDEEWKLFHRQHNTIRRCTSDALVWRTEITACGHLRWSFGYESEGFSLVVKSDSSQRPVLNPIPVCTSSIELSLSNAWGLLSYLSFIEEIPYGSLHLENDYVDPTEIADIWQKKSELGLEWNDHFNKFSCTTEET